MLRLGIHRCWSDRVLAAPHIAHRRPRYFGPTTLSVRRFLALAHVPALQSRCDPSVVRRLDQKVRPNPPRSDEWPWLLHRCSSAEPCHLLLERDWLGKLQRVSCGFRTGLSPLDPGSVPPRWARHWRVAVRRINVVAVGKGASIRRTVIFP